MIYVLLVLGGIVFGWIGHSIIEAKRFLHGALDQMPSQWVERVHQRGAR